ncbi:MAG: GatB/YqeY domain-containing protein [Propionibacteriaceae bacterium]|nr:GatB/YqeY domain-containing protein [Propionibacteriaceae bacterium]
MGSLKTRLREDLVVALRAKDEAAKTNIRLTLGAIQMEEVAGESARELSDAEELALVQREVRKRRDAAEAYAAGGRPELAAKENAEADWLSRYLPAPLSADEIRAIVDEEVARVEGASLKQMGQIIKAVNARVAGRAEGKLVAAAVRAALA